MAVLVQDGCYGLGCQPATQGYQCPALTGRLLLLVCVPQCRQRSGLAFSLTFILFIKFRTCINVIMLSALYIWFYTLNIYIILPPCIILIGTV